MDDACIKTVRKADGVEFASQTPTGKSAMEAAPWMALYQDPPPTGGGVEFASQTPTANGGKDAAVCRALTKQPVFGRLERNVRV